MPYGRSSTIIFAMHHIRKKKLQTDLQAGNQQNYSVCRLLQICACIVINDQLTKYIALDAGILTYAFLLIIKTV
jgi:hypothetical protein